MEQLGALNLASRRAIRTLSKNSPTIFTALGVAGVITSVALTIKATPKALEIIENEEKYRMSEIQDPDYGVSVDLVDKIKLTWQCYIPTVTSVAFTIGCIILSNKVNLQRNAALVSMLSIAETSFKEYQNKVFEMVGEKKEAIIRGELAKEALEKNPLEGKTVLITNGGSTLCYDKLTGRYFYSDIETIRRSMNDFNERLISEMVLSLNEWYYSIGLEPVDVGASNGWVLEKGKVDLHFSAILNKDKVPALVIEHRNLPVNIWG